MNKYTLSKKQIEIIFMLVFQTSSMTEYETGEKWNVEELYKILKYDEERQYFKEWLEQLFNLPILK